FAERRLSEAYPYLILDARYERIREAGAIQSQAVLIAIGVDWEGRRPLRQAQGEGARRRTRQPREPLELARLPRRAQGARIIWRRVRRLGRSRGLKVAIREVLPEAVWQRCYVHFLRNALDYVPRKVDDDCLMELRWFGAC